MAVPTPPAPPLPRYPPYGGNSGGSGGGAAGGGSATGTGVYVPTSNGGVFAQSRSAMYPVLNLVNGNMEYYSFNPMVAPNDIVTGSSYSWKVEQVKPFRSFTTRGICWMFTDLGQVTATWTMTGVNESQNVVSIPKTVQVGNQIPTGKIMAVLISFGLTAMNQQLSVSRSPNAGPLSIVKVTLYGECEENQLA